MIQDGTVTPKSDIYAIGIILWEMCSHIVTGCEVSLVKSLKKDAMNIHLLATISEITL